MYSSDLLLIQSLKKGDEQAFGILFDKYADRVYSSALSLIKDSGWSEDIVQEVFIKLWSNRAGLLEDGNLWNFLTVLTRREAYNKLRGVKRSQLAFDRLWGSFESLHFDTENVIFSKDGLRHLQKVVQMLPPKQQQVFILNKIEGLSYEEIAKKLEISTSTVRNHLVTATKVIKSKVSRADILGMLIYLYL